MSFGGAVGEMVGSYKRNRAQVRKRKSLKQMTEEGYTAKVAGDQREQQRATPEQMEVVRSKMAAQNKQNRKARIIVLLTLGVIGLIAFILFATL